MHRLHRGKHDGFVNCSGGFTRRAARYFPELSFACLETNNGWGIVKRLTFIGVRWDESWTVNVK